VGQRAHGIAAAGTLLALIGTAAVSEAADPADVPPLQGGTSALRSGVESRRPYWQGSGTNRPFVSATFDLGVLYWQPTMAVGYGKPHYQWFGAEIYATGSQSGGRGYAGLHGQLPGLDLRVGARYEFPIGQGFLPPQDAYERDDLDNRHLGLARYLAAQAELGGWVELFGGTLFAVASGYALVGVPADRYVFEESLRVVAAPPWLWRARAGYLAHIGWLETMQLGGAAEAIHSVGRGKLLVRAGPVISVALTHHLEAIGVAMFVAASPDRLGLIGAEFGQLGLRYRWATGDRWPEFP